MSLHLTDDQFAECAFSAPDAAAAAHLATCAACREELVTLQQTLGDFGRTTEAWSQAMPTVSLRGRAKQQQRRTTVRTAWAFAMALLIAVSLPFLSAHRDTVKTQTATAVVQQDSAAQIAQDNQLMQNVYMALTPDDASTVREYNIPVASKSSHADMRTRIQ